VEVVVVGGAAESRSAMITYVREFIGSMGSDAVLQRELRNNNKGTKERKYGKKFKKKKWKTKDGEGRNKRSEKNH